MSQDFDLSGIIVLTGLPGAGKTLRMMEIAERAVKEGRPVFQNGINGMCLPGVQEWEDPHAWKDLPPRAVLLVDEGQRHFRARPGSRAVPDSITDMELIRHSSVCLVITTQQPTYLDKHLRGLAQHQHLVEVLAGKTSNVYSFRSVRDDITPGSLADAQMVLWHHPNRFYNSYISAEAHTKKLRIPFRLKALAAFAVVVIGYCAWAFFGPDPAADIEARAGATAPAALPVGAVLADGSPPLDPLAYAARLQPRFANMPGSAPIFDGRQAVSEPLIACMSSAPGAGVDGRELEASCTCLTEQGTMYVMPYTTCRSLARNGPSYDPFKQPETTTQVDAGAGEPLASEQPFTASVDAPQIAAYGDIGVGNDAADQAQ